MSRPLDIAQLAEAAGIPLAVAEHYAPLLALLGAMIDRRGATPAPPHPTEATSGLAIESGRLYTPEEAARLLGFGTPEEPRTKTLYDIPEADLPKCRVGPARGAVRYFGADLIAYAKGLPPLDYGEHIDRIRRQLARPSPVRPMTADPAAPRRVL